MQVPELGVLDFFQSLAHTLALAPAAEQMGYRRYWLAEHLPQPHPAIAVALVAGVTETIRVGTAAILMRFHAPARAAVDFHLLEAVFAGRIDAGFCAGLAAPEQLLPDLLDGPVQLGGGEQDRRASAFIRHLRARPDDATDRRLVWSGAEHGTPEIWVHGTGARSARLAAEHGIALGYSLFHTAGNGDPGPVAEYRERFEPKGALEGPRVAIAIAGVCASSEAAARSKAAACEVAHIRTNVIGTIRMWRERLEEISEQYRPDTIVVFDLCADLEARQDSLAGIAEAAGIAARRLQRCRS